MTTTKFEESIIERVLSPVKYLHTTYIPMLLNDVKKHGVDVNDITVQYFASCIKNKFDNAQWSPELVSFIELVDSSWYTFQFVQHMAVKSYPSEEIGDLRNSLDEDNA